MTRPLPTLINRALRIYWRLVKPHTFGVRALILGPKDRILLVKHTYDRYWYMPGGSRKRNESPVAAIRREVKEELGIADLRVERRLSTYRSTFEGKRDTIDVFIARAETIAGLQRLEIEEARWFDLDGLPAEVSPATRRRIQEFLGVKALERTW